jgi:hypothetical protein
MFFHTVRLYHDSEWIEDHIDYSATLYELPSILTYPLISRIGRAHPEIERLIPMLPLLARHSGGLQIARAGIRQSETGAMMLVEPDGGDERALVLLITPFDEELVWPAPEDRAEVLFSACSAYSNRGGVPTRRSHLIILEPGGHVRVRPPLASGAIRVERAIKFTPCGLELRATDLLNCSRYELAEIAA